VENQVNIVCILYLLYRK